MKPSFRTTLLTVLTICISISFASAQCNQNISLSGQAAVNGFKHNYGCTTIDGTLSLSGAISNLDSLSGIVQVKYLFVVNCSLTDFRGLSSLTRVVEGMDIEYNRNLTSFDGLESLESIGYLFIGNDSSLTTLSGLQGLNKVRQHLYITRNPLLLSLNGLQGLDSIGTDLKVYENAMLQNLTGLDNLASAGFINIQQNPSLFSFEGLGNLSHLTDGFNALLNPMVTSMGHWDKLIHAGKLFEIYISPLLTSLEGLHLQDVAGDPVTHDGGLIISQTAIKDCKGLEDLDHVDGRFYLYYNESLKNLHGLENLRFVNGHFGIEDNHILTSIEAIGDLEYITGEMEITDNDSLSICSYPFVCKYLAAPPGLVLVFGNAPGCETEEDIQSNCSPIIEFNLIEANLEVDDSIATTGEVTLLSPLDLVGLKKKRAAVATDGVSTVLVRIATDGKGYIDIDHAEEDGFEFPWGDSTYLVNGKNYLFMLYTPPDDFDETQSLFAYGDGIDAYNINFDYLFDNGTDIRQNHISITHVRPPVVLMHGTYSDPDLTWKTAQVPGLSMYDRLTNEGFKVFTVNYKETNGTTGFGSDNTSFQSNAKVLWGDVYPQNTGGIKDALHYYRNNLGIAVTQADVVGHSLGGILPRVYASPQYNPDYKRAENFMEGDINRLITLGSTHFGSNLGELQLFLDGITPFNIGALDWLALQGANLCTQWVGGASPSHAVMDQLPPPTGTALGLIGRTEIPSHAITLSVPKGGLKDAMFDPDESYYDLYWFITTLMYQIHDVRSTYLDSKLALIGEGLQADGTITGASGHDLYSLYTNTMLYKTMIEDAIASAGIVTSVLDGTFELPSNQEVFKYALGETGMSSLADPLYDVFVAGADPVGVATDYFFNVSLPTPQSILLDQLKVKEASIEALRSVIFNHDANDGVVRVQSQSGELEKECPGCVSHYDNVLHGFAPRYPQVQDRIVQLLKSEKNGFAPNGFPPVDHAQKLYYPPESLDLFKVPVSGGEAICQSGMVPAHARAFAHVADQTNSIIIIRPVNADATDLIARNMATKEMDVKAKTSNWGPQKGFIPVDQRYSKLSKIYEGEKRRQIVHQFDSLAQTNLTNGITLARPLQIKSCNGFFNVYIDFAKFTGANDDNPDDEVVLVPESDPTQVCRWGSDFSSSQMIMDCIDRGPQHLLSPMLAMASPQELEDNNVDHRFLTADYDMLMVGFHTGPDLGAPMPPDVPFKPKVGQITEDQEILVEELNDAVDATGYRAGKVVHHGPENQYTKSPYIDYPLTVFAPDNIPNGLFQTSTDGLILSIPQGPPGFRDIHLKQFVNRMRREGYDLYQNAVAPGWKWTWNNSAEAFHLEDDKNLGGSVEPHPANDCSKFGGQEPVPCPVLPPATSGTNEKKGPGKEGGIHRPVNASFNIVPNIVYDQQVVLNSEITGDIQYSWMIIDPMGNLFEKGVVNNYSHFNTILLDVHNLQPGVYTIMTDKFGEAGRFVKM